MIPPEFQHVARAYRLLGDLEPKHLRKLIPLAEEMQFAPGQIIFKEHDRSSFLYLIVSGEVELEMKAGGATVSIQKLQAGETMGWSVLTEEGETHFQARALTPVSTIAFPSHSIRQACECDPEMGYALMKRLLELVTERLDAARMQIVQVRRDAELARQV